MKRLWVRLSLMISGVLFFVFFLQFLSIVLLPDTHQDAVDGAAANHAQVEAAERPEIARRLIDFGVLSVVVGTAGGFLIGRLVTRPINHLVGAANLIGKGDLSVRVPVEGSQEIQDLARTFNKMAGDLQHAEALRSSLTADISHELRTPLTALEGNLRAALDHVYTLDEAEIASLYGQTRHLIRLVNDLRELSLAENQQLPLECHPTDLNALIAEVLSALEPLSTEKQITLVDRSEALPEVQLDPIRIRQVLFNLLINALRHTPEGGEISVRAVRGAGEVQVAVQDNGDGLEADQLDAVFDRFYRADVSRSRETGGTGLGLAIVKALIEAQGGQIQAFSAGKDRGCTFTFHLPMC